MSNPLHRYHVILHAIASSPQGLGLADLAAATSLPRSTAHRMASALREIDYVDIDPRTGNYILGNGIVALMRQSLMQDKRLAAFKPALNLIVHDLGETAFFARFMDNRVDLVEALTPTARDRLYIFPGVGGRPLDKCSSSKAILAYRSPKEVETLLQPDHGLGDHERLDGLIDELHRVSQQGYAVCDGEIDEGVYSVSCPVIVGDMAGLYSVGVVGPAARLKDRDVNEIVSVLQAGAALAVEGLLTP
ncbi:IclR family transcriptional regulator [Parapusillimonas sp. SGNA-6]|nr:IclR family transcriptional regulator [Parapusillimonas sp. SGNA-6]